mmetsp:Transcript_7263/g.6391  ORF Transcript_7263/g.6391 Transcript_7263/m.6391 type:complete len:435 (-) Transcript_7263:972-2276(-)
MAFLLPHFFLLQVLQEFLGFVPLGEEVDGQVVDGFVLGEVLLDAVVHDVLEGLVHGEPGRNVHEGRDQLRNVDLPERVLPQRVQRVDRDLLDQHRRVPQHDIVASLLVADDEDLVQGLRVLLLVDVVDDDRLVVLHVLRELDALLDLPVTLQHLEDRVLVDVPRVPHQELVERLLQNLDRLLRRLLTLLVLDALVVGLVVVDLVELQLHDPGRQQHPLRLQLLLLLVQLLQHLYQVLLQVHVEVVLEELEGDLFEGLFAPGEVIRSHLVLLLREQLLRIDPRHEPSLLQSLASHQCIFDEASLEVVLPGVLVFAFEVCEEDFFLGGVEEGLVGEEVHLDALEDEVIVLIVHDFIGDLGQNSQILRVHEYDVVGGEGEGVGEVVVDDVVALFLEVADHLEVLFLEDQVPQLQIEVPVTEPELIHPPEPSHLSCVV